MLLYLWSIWSAIFLAPRKEVVATLSTVLTDVAIWLWTLDVARPVVSVLLLLGLAHGVLVIGQTLHRNSTGVSE